MSLDGAYTRFVGLLRQAKKVENGIVNFFKLRPENIFGGDTVKYDLIKRARTLPKAKKGNSGYENLESDSYKTASFDPPAYKPRMNYAIGQTINRMAGTTVFDDIDKTALLMSKTAEDVKILLDKIEMGMLLQASEIWQYGKIRFASVYGYEVPDIDYGAPAGHFADVTTSWIAGGGDPISDIEAHIEKITKAGRARVDNLIFGTAALSGMLQNTRVKDELNNRRIDRGNMSFQEVQMDGMARIGIYNFKGVNVVFWTFNEYYETKSATDVVDGTVDFIHTNNVVFIASGGDYQRYYAGIDTIKTVPKDLTGFLPSPNITLFGDKIATSVYIDTKEVSEGENEGVFLRAASKPLLVSRTPDTYGRLTVIV